MSRRYLLLSGAVVAAALALTALGRPRMPVAGHSTGAAADAPAVELSLVVEDGGLRPSVSSVAKGSRVRLRVEHRGSRPARLALAGYEDLMSIPTLAPGTTWTGELVAGRPGEDFAWLLDGEPRGRLSVTGSHLVDGHR